MGRKKRNKRAGKERRFAKIKQKFDAKSLTIEEYLKLQNDKKKMYLEHVIGVSVNCIHCGENFHFETGGYISDDEMMERIAAKQQKY